MGLSRLSIPYIVPYSETTVPRVIRSMTRTLMRTAIVLKVWNIDGGSCCLVKFGRNGFLFAQNLGNKFIVLQFSHGICKQVRLSAVKFAWMTNRKYKNVFYKGLVEDNLEFYRVMGEIYIESFGTRRFAPLVKEYKNQQA